MKSPDYKKAKSGPSPKRLFEDWHRPSWQAGSWGSWGRWNSWRDDWSYGCQSGWDDWDWEESQDVPGLLSKLDSVMESVPEEQAKQAAAEASQKGPANATGPTQESANPTVPTQESTNPIAPTQESAKATAPRQDGASTCAAKEDDCWKSDKRGQPLTPAALYMRFYRSLRSTLPAIINHQTFGTLP